MFLVIQRVEISGSSTAASGGGVEPVFCRGINSLKQKLDRMDHLFRRAIVVEISQMAARIAEFLDQAPFKRRGRQPSKSV